MYSFSYLEPVCCSMSSSNCCFLTCIQISQEAGQVVWYFHLFQNFPQFVVIHTVKGFGIVSKAEIDVFLELSCFFDDPAEVGNLISGSSAFLKPAWIPGNSWFTYCWSVTWRVLSITLLASWAIVKSAALNMPANVENSAVVTGLEKVSFHSNPKERQCQRMLKLPHNCTHLTC